VLKRLEKENKRSKRKLDKVIRHADKWVHKNLPTVDSALRKIPIFKSYEEDTEAYKAKKAGHKGEKEGKVLAKASKIQAKHTKAREERAKAREKD